MTIKRRKYFITPLQNDCFQNAIINEVLFLTLYKKQNNLSHSESYYDENNLDTPIIKMLPFIFAGKNIYWRVCQSIIKTLGEDEISIILG